MPALLLAQPTQQAVNSPSFSAPPVDGSLSVSQMVDHHLVYNPSHPCFRYKSPASGLPYEELLWGDVARAIHRAARFVKSCVETTITITSAANPPVIAILSTAEIPHYYTFAYGVSRAGYVAHFISTRNSPPTATHLFLTTGVTHVFVDDALRGLVDSAIDALQSEESAIIPQSFKFPAFKELCILNDPDFVPLPPMGTPDIESVAIIWNSSGSTSFPKVINMTHRVWIEHGRIPWDGDADICGEVMGTHSLLPFHLYGGSAFAITATCGSICAAWSPWEPRAEDSTAGILEETIATQTTILLTVPSKLEAWANDPASVAALAKIKCVRYAGASLNQAAGDILSARGVPIAISYGTTEAGAISRFIIDLSQEPADEWEYFYINPQVDVTLEPVGGASGMFEVFVHPSPAHTVSVIDAEVNGKPANATKDIIIQHPTNPKKFKVIGRADHLFSLSTGEKLNPIPIENHMRSDPAVKAAIMFGQGKARVGVLVEPTDSVDINDKKAVASFRDAIWGTVQKAGGSTYGHARVAKEMIVVASPLKPFEYTSKGSVKRQFNLDIYRKEIEAAYAATSSA
ncbi:hypothetical protein BOTBODRAFT_160791 [Botryobasidium botryosum FD-172 SS1]|uniref:AMP-dependent synthetase/ligase domain-containing protein n=1 Tax=Botryobasidium botryosum (strain FD-172 SS1) TaxID=930990 RepID=A0A067MNL4_BOTB1|nr:hypothetical protein BOTBODRAFT_160791 [Botryobasidium botryosum FD-172 SS1]